MPKTEIEVIYIILLSSVIILSLTSLIVFIFSELKKNILKSKNDLQTLIYKHEKEILTTQLEIQEETFNKISREIHDNIGLGLTLAKLQINNYSLQKQDNHILLSSTIDLISKSLVDLNDISKSLDSGQLTSYGLINALEAEVAVIGKSGIYQVEFEVIGESVYLDSETDLVLLRIFQEACNNIIKHARATRIIIDMIYEKNHVSMKISDNGKGFNVDEMRNKKEIRKMAGLKNFYTRSELIKAEVQITSVIGIGTTIHIKAPIKN